MADIRRQRPYEIQLERVKRRKQIIENTLNNYRNGVYSKGIVELYDDVMMFFIFCYHLKDYIVNDRSLEVNRGVVENYINSKDCLKICADICNGIKHLKLIRKRTDDGEFLINIRAERDEKTDEMFIELNIKSKTIKDDFIKIAEDCISAWENFIKIEIASKPKKQIQVHCPSCEIDFEVDDDLIMCDCPNCGQKNILV